MEYEPITVVEIDVSKGKRTVTVCRPGGQVVLPPFAVEYNSTATAGGNHRVNWEAIFVLSWNIQGCTGVPLR